MPTVEHKGKFYPVDDDGFLANPGDWDPDWVDHVRQIEGTEEVTDDHWKVMNALREYYERCGIPPMTRIFSKVTGLTLKRIYELFPSGPGMGACKMAGIPRPLSD